MMDCGNSSNDFVSVPKQHELAHGVMNPMPHETSWIRFPSQQAFLGQLYLALGQYVQHMNVPVIRPNDFLSGATHPNQQRRASLLTPAKRKYGKYLRSLLTFVAPRKSVGASTCSSLRFFLPSSLDDLAI